MPARAGDEDGFSLIELLIAVVVLGTGVVAVLAAMTTSITSSDVHRSLAGGEAVTRDYADAVKAKALAATTFTLCPPATALTPDFDEPGYTVTITAVEYWDPDEGDPRNGSYGSRAGCLAEAAARCAGLPDPLPPSCDSGVQRVTMEVRPEGKSGAAATTTTSRVVVRRGNA
ncbi:MAG: prepilin-type N-terminal cleavage/methylation domain-containing protein [Acidimicrobiia bacterium]